MKKHKERKLRLLVANDDMFQLLIISNSLKPLKFIDRIDQACNGQEALDLVVSNEQHFATTGERIYDIIFLDLGMPIKDGYEACKLIVDHYKQLKEQRFLMSSEPAAMEWFTDLIKVFQEYQYSHSQPLQDILMRVFKRVRFNSLSQLDKPLIFAYSQFVDNDILEKSKQVGFDNCIDGKLDIEVLQYVISDYIDPLTDQLL